MRIGRNVCGYLGCQQVHMLYPDLPMTRRLRDDPNVIREQKVSIFIPGTEEREDSCVCGAKVVVPPVAVLSLDIPPLMSSTSRCASLFALLACVSSEAG